MHHHPRHAPGLSSVLLLAAAVSGCNRPAPQSEITRPDWRGAAIAGIAPLMSAREAMAGIERSGYRRIACDDKEKTGKAEAGQACYLSADGKQRAFLGFDKFPNDRVVTYINFHDVWTPSMSDEQRMQRSRANAKALEQRFGKPSFHSGSPPRVVTYYWKRPGGRENLPDVISTTVAPEMGANVTMTSYWKPSPG